jgi:hypothetical protein
MKSTPALRERVVPDRVLGNVKHRTIPPTRLLLFAVRERPCPRTVSAAEQQIDAVTRNGRERLTLLMCEFETKFCRVEGDGTRDISRLVTDAVHTER